MAKLELPLPRGVSLEVSINKKGYITKNAEGDEEKRVMFTRKLYLTGTKAPLFKAYRMTVRRKLNEAGKVTSCNFTVKGLPFPLPKKRGEATMLNLDLRPEVVVGYDWNKEVAALIRAAGGEPGNECYTPRVGHLDDELALHGKTVDRFDNMNAAITWLDKFVGNRDASYLIIKFLLEGK